jgi:excisionase family DNA binding protein
MEVDDPSALLCVEQAARQLNLSASTLAKMRLRGDGPAFVKLRHLVRYRRSDLEAYIAAGVRRSTSDSAKAAKTRSRGRSPKN